MSNYIDLSKLEEAKAQAQASAAEKLDPKPHDEVFGDADSILVVDPENEAAAQQLEAFATEMPEEFEKLTVFTPEQAHQKLNDMLIRNNADLADLADHPDPRLRISINPSEFSAALLALVVDRLFPEGTIARTVLDIEFQSGPVRELIQGGFEFRDQVSRAGLTQGVANVDASKLRG